MALFVSMADVACVLRTTLADLRVARRVFRPYLHVVRPRVDGAGRGLDLLGLEGLLGWLTSAMGDGFARRIAADLTALVRMEHEFDRPPSEQL